MDHILCKKIRSALLVVAFLVTFALHAKDKFPVPSGNANQLFYLQRTSNTNTIVCELNHKNGVLNVEEPIHVFWLRYSDKGQREELNYVQKKFAYGVKTTLISPDKYELHFVSYKKYTMQLMRSPGNKYNVYGTINQKQAIVNRIFVKINGGSFWSPKVEYVEVKGTDPVTGKEVMERMKI